MNKKRSQKHAPGRDRSAPSPAIIGKPPRPLRSLDFWKPFEQYNRLDTGVRASALADLGIIEVSPEVKGVLSKSHFVIPGVTRFECQKCGECCRYARKVAQLTYEPCPFLSPDNTCAKHDSRYLVCKWFPYWIFNHQTLGPLLTVKPYCSGYDNGPVIDYDGVMDRLTRLKNDEIADRDGAFVIHEVLLIPGRKDWAFPSKENVDALILHIRRESSKLALHQTSPAERPLDRAGEVHYAHHYTSGLLGSINSPLLTVNENRVVTDLNEEACRLLNRERNAVIGRPFQEHFVNPDRVSSSLSTCFSAGKETAAPQRLRMPDETSVPILLNAVTFRDRCDGLVHAILVCLNPVSAAVFSEVSRTRNYARCLLEASLDALMVVDRDGVITDVNESLVSISERPREDLLGMRFSDLFQNDREAANCIGDTFARGNIRMMDLLLVPKQGEPIPVSLNATVFRDADGVIQGIFASARDIRERLRMVAEVEEAGNYARGLIECCIDLMVTVDRFGIITDANRAAAKHTGHEVRQLIGSTFKDYFSEPDKAKRGVDLAFEHGEVRNFDLKLITKEGKPVPVSFNATLYRDKCGEIQGVFAVARVKD